MKFGEFNNLEKWFNNYISDFYSQDDEINTNITLKREHTNRVCKKIKELADFLHLSLDDLYLAKAIALLHDLGRFDQYYVYRTFNDKKSENHSLLGLKILENHSVLKFMKQEEKEILKKAIYNHNLPYLEDNLSENTAMFCKIIRDADKIDILRIVTIFLDSSNQTKEAVGEGLSQENYITSKVLEDFYKINMVYSEDLNTVNDFILHKLSWIFDINYIYSLRDIYHKGYCQKLLNALPENNTETEKVKSQINDFFTKKLKLNE